MTKFKFGVDGEVDPKDVRAMLTRGYEAHKAALDAENLRHSKTRDNVAYMLDPERTTMEDSRHKAALEKLQKEGDLWKQILLSFTKVEE